MTCFRPVSLLLLTSSLVFRSSCAFALPPATDPPEEVLRTEIITDARSPLDGQSLTPAAYAELQAEIQKGQPVQPQVSRSVRRTIGLLRLRRFIKTVFPFIPVK